MQFFLMHIFVGFVCVVAQTTCKTDEENKYVKTGPTVVDFEYVKKASDDGNILIIDVRQSCEVEHGIIPNSINIPIGGFADALGPMTSEEEFLEKYHWPKPKKDTEFIIYCKIGKRSTITANQAVDLGYTNVKNYVGSWTEWTEKI